MSDNTPLTIPGLDLSAVPETSAAPPVVVPEQQLNDLRVRILKGETVSVEEYALVITSLRQRRLGETAATEAKKKEKAAKAKATAAPVDLDALLGGLLPKV